MDKSVSETTNFQRLVYRWTLVALPSLFVLFDFSMPSYKFWGTRGGGLKCLIVQRLDATNALKNK